MVNLHVENWSARDLRYSAAQSRNKDTKMQAKIELSRRGLTQKPRSTKEHSLSGLGSGAFKPRSLSGF